MCHLSIQCFGIMQHNFLPRKPKKNHRQTVKIKNKTIIILNETQLRNKSDGNMANISRKRD